MPVSRREVLRLVAGSSALAALSQLGAAAAVADTSNYRAMVAVFLAGGADSNNMLVPTDSRYAGYASARTSVLALPQSSLAPLAGSPFGLHPSLAPLKAIWNEGALGFVLNAGPLFQPLTKSLYQSRADLRPLNLMSHSSQQNAWQAMATRASTSTGFMGRANDRGAGGGQTPSLISLSGSQLALIGSQTSPLVLPSSGNLVRLGYYPGSANAEVAARQNAIAAFADGAASGAVTRITGAGMSTAYDQAIAANAVIGAASSSVDQYFKHPTTGAALTSDISRQLLRAARMIEARGSLGHAKQMFFINQGGYDHHAGEVVSGDPTTGVLANLYADLANALSGFYAAMKALGLSEQVTAFTMSDFGRVLKANASLGCDHAWGGHQMVMGAALKSKTIHGAYPNTTLGGPDDILNDGRWLPTIAMEEYVGAIAKWYGVANADLPYVFPNWSTWNGGGRGPVPLFG